MPNLSRRHYKILKTTLGIKGLHLNFTCPVCETNSVRKSGAFCDDICRQLGTFIRSLTSGGIRTGQYIRIKDGWRSIDEIEVWFKSAIFRFHPDRNRSPNSAITPLLIIARDNALKYARKNNLPEFF